MTDIDMEKIIICEEEVNMEMVKQKARARMAVVRTLLRVGTAEAGTNSRCPTSGSN